MIGTDFDPVFSSAIREELRSLAFTPRRASFWRVHARLGIGLAVGGSLLIGGGAAAAGLLTQPGGTAVTKLSATTIVTETGTATIELGAAPSGTTNILVSLSCLTAGVFTFDDGVSVHCSNLDAGTRTGHTEAALAVKPGQHATTITTTPGARWSAEFTWINERITEWAVNDDGNTYGAINQNGEPDLIAVVASNGKQGYVYATQLAEADGSAAALKFTSPEQALAWQKSRIGKTFSVTVYESDGKTVVGEFVING